MFINGYSHPGATENTRLVGTDAKLLIELDGSNAGQAGTNGLSIESSNVTVRGLVIRDFSLRHSLKTKTVADLRPPLRRGAFFQREVGRMKLCPSSPGDALTCYMLDRITA